MSPSRLRCRRSRCSPARRKDPRVASVWSSATQIPLMAQSSANDRIRCTSLSKYDMLSCNGIFSLAPTLGENSHKDLVEALPGFFRWSQSVSSGVEALPDAHQERHACKSSWLQTDRSHGLHQNIGMVYSWV